MDAHMVSEPGGGVHDPYGPVNHASRGGLIKYRNRGLGADKRKHDAYRQMFNACSGYYRIDAEGPRSEGGQIVNNGLGGVTFLPTEYWYIHFSCVPPSPRGTIQRPRDARSNAPSDDEDETGDGQPR